VWLEAVAVGMEEVMQGQRVAQAAAAALRMYVLGVLHWPTELLLPEVVAAQDAAVSKRVQEEDLMEITEVEEEERKWQAGVEIIRDL